MVLMKFTVQCLPSDGSQFLRPLDRASTMQFRPSTSYNADTDSPRQHDDVSSDSLSEEMESSTSSGTTAMQRCDEDRTPSDMAPCAGGIQATVLTPGDSVSNQRPPSQNDNGQVQLAAYCNSGLLTLHVMKAKLPSLEVDQHAVAVYIKVALLPDKTGRTVCKTDVMMMSTVDNCVEFDAKFSYELLEDDLKKKICITAWRSSPNKHQTRFLGAVSFDVRNACQQQSPIKGWFPLSKSSFVSPPEHVTSTGSALSAQSQSEVEPTGRVQASRLSRSVSSTSSTSTMILETRLILVYRGRSGFGFSISGQDPVVVCRVDAGSMAQIAGLDINDRILRLDGHNVARSNSEHVAALVRKATHKVVLEIQRPTIRSSSMATDSIPLQSSNHKSLRQPPPSVSGQQNRDLQLRPRQLEHRRRQHQNGAAVHLQQQRFVRSGSEPLLDVSSSDHAPPISLRSSVMRSLGPNQPPQQASSFGSRRCADSDDVSGTIAVEHPAVSRVDYGWVDPVGDDDDDDDDSDKENMATFPRGFRPAARHNHKSKNRQQNDTQSKRKYHTHHVDSYLESGSSMKKDRPGPTVIEEDRHVEMLSALWDQSRQADNREKDARVTTMRRHLGTIVEVTEMSDCSAITFQLQNLRSADVSGDTDVDEGHFSTHEDGAFQNNAERHIGSSAASTATVGCSLDTPKVSSSLLSPSSSKSGDIGEDLSERLSTASTLDTSVNVERQPYCSGVLTFRSGKKRFGLIDMYRQRRQQRRKSLDSGNTGVDENTAEEASINSDCLSVTSGVSCSSDAPPFKRQRISSFKKIIRNGIHKLQRKF